MSPCLDAGMATAAGNTTRTNDTAPPSGAADAVVVSVDTEDFHEALRRYVDDAKPDPLSEKQMTEEWTLEWKQHQKQQQDKKRQDEGQNRQHQRRRRNNAFSIEGRLLWKGRYAQVALDATCRWSDDAGGGSGDAGDGCAADAKKEEEEAGSIGTSSLHFRCTASAELIADNATGVVASDGKKKKVDRAEKKVRDKMLKRLRQDDYVRKLLKKKDAASGGGVEDDEGGGLLLCQADILFCGGGGGGDKKSAGTSRTQQLEERVYTDEMACEAIRRCVWSATNDTIDVLDFVLQLPFLPRKSAATTTATATITTPLADRAQLRMLEDAMYDACEKEGEDELVEGLEISQSQKKKAKTGTEQ